MDQRCKHSACNEKRTIETIVGRVLLTEVAGCEIELLVVDDGSSDGTSDLLAGIAGRESRVRVFRLKKNSGKGAALRRGFQEASGDIVLVQDSDLEYDPRDYPALLAPILDGNADVVYGSRFLGGPHRVLYFWHAVGNRWLTLFSNAFTGLNLTDMETGYKVFRAEVLRRFVVKQNRFGFEPEVTAKGGRARVRVYEVPISYAGRTYEEGKKILSFSTP